MEKGIASLTQQLDILTISAGTSSQGRPSGFSKLQKTAKDEDNDNPDCIPGPMKTSDSSTERCPNGFPKLHETAKDEHTDGPDYIPKVAKNKNSGFSTEECPNGFSKLQKTAKDDDPTNPDHIPRPARNNGPSSQRRSSNFSKLQKTAKDDHTNNPDYIPGQTKNRNKALKHVDPPAATVPRKSSRPPKPRTFSPTVFSKFLNQKRQDLNQQMEVNSSSCFIRDDYEVSTSAIKMIKKGTGVIFEDEFALHDCPWDSNYPENSQRYKAVLNRCSELGLIDRCIRIKATPAHQDYILQKHTAQHLEKFREICQKNEADMEVDASQYDAVYFNKATYETALLAAGAAINLVEAICKEEVQNGMAIIRPPGHHAMKNDFCGYCYFNNVAIAAEYALQKKLASRILIIDFDVHHGQATQQMFYEDERVLYFSIHRYEHGKFWPNLKESNFDYTGLDTGKNYNINFPLNKTGLGDSEYLSIICNLLLPVAYKFQPNLILFSAGYDASIGCPEGEMHVTPGFYGHLISLFSGLACGKLGVFLEGGYFLPSLAEGAAMTLKALLGDPLPILKPIHRADQSVIDTIYALKILLKDKWQCLDEYHDMPNSEALYLGGGDLKTEPPFPTRNCYAINTPEKVAKYTEILEDYKIENNKLDCPQLISVSYDEIMEKHKREDGLLYREAPERLAATYKVYQDWGSHSRCLNLSAKLITADILKLIHESNYVNKIVEKRFVELLDNKSDMYYNDSTLLAIEKGVGCLLAVVDSVMTRETSSGFALIRPPGHHAEYDKALGFCYCNNVAIAAKYILNTYKTERILIVDFDVHHGNGTQKLFYHNKNVLYISVHRYDNARYFPYFADADCTYTGEGAGLGYNVNIPLNTDSYGNDDYLSIFHSVILPVAYSFAPEVVLISAGFDAGIYDFLGNYLVTPECFGHFVQLLKGLANGKLIMALEGGYNITTLSHSVNICIKTLLGDPLPLLDSKEIPLKMSLKKTISLVMKHQKQHWPALLAQDEAEIEARKRELKETKKRVAEEAKKEKRGTRGKKERSERGKKERSRRVKKERGGRGQKERGGRSRKD